MGLFSESQEAIDISLFTTLPAGFHPTPPSPKAMASNIGPYIKDACKKGGGELAQKQTYWGRLCEFSTLDYSKMRTRKDEGGWNSWNFYGCPLCTPCFWFTLQFWIKIWTWRIGFQTINYFAFYWTWYHFVLGSFMWFLTPYWIRKRVISQKNISNRLMMSKVPMETSRIDPPPPKLRRRSMKIVTFQVIFMDGRLKFPRE